MTRGDGADPGATAAVPARAAAPTTATATPPPLAPLWSALLLALLFALALGLRLIGLGGAVTEDEDQWIARSGTFAHGLTSGEWRRTYLTGHPGVTVMWLTTLTLGPARAMPFERTSGSPDVTTVPGFLSALDRARVPFAVLQAGLVVLVAVLAARLLGPATGLVAGLLLAAEPFWVGVGPVVGMDGLLSGFMTVSLLALLLATAPGPPAVGRRLAWATLGGVAVGLAFLTKTTALFLGPVVPGLVLLSMWEQWRRHRAAVTLSDAAAHPGAVPVATAPDAAVPPDVTPPDAAALPVTVPTPGGRWWAAPLLVAGVWGAAAALVIWLAWPAMWLTPLATFWRALTFSANLGGSPHGPGTFLLGQPTDDPGALFYPVALLVRIGPGVMLGLLLLFVMGARRPVLRVVWPLVGFVLLFLLLLTLAAKKVDRYLLPILPTLGILAAVGWLEAARGLWNLVQRRRTRTDPVRPRAALTPRPPLPLAGEGLGVRVFSAAVLAFAVQVWPVVLAGPYPLAGYNPLVGGVRAAERAIPVGWGDGLDVAGARIRELAGPRVAVTAIWSPLRVNFGAHAPGPVVSERQLAQADFYVDYVHARQRGLTPRSLQGRTPDATVTIGGVDYARIYRLR